jgi:hypothetical protein
VHELTQGSGGAYRRRAFTDTVRAVDALKTSQAVACHELAEPKSVELWGYNVPRAAVSTTTSALCGR